MPESRIEHLKMVQGVIDRMAQNSFRLKGWAAVLLSALLGLAASDSNSRIALVALVPIAMLWSLDAYFLRQEKLFRALYDNIRKDTKNEADFSMDTNGLVGEVKSLGAIARSVTVAAFYGVMLVTVLAAACILGDP